MLCVYVKEKKCACGVDDVYMVGDDRCHKPLVCYKKDKEKNETGQRDEM